MTTWVRAGGSPVDTVVEQQLLKLVTLGPIPSFVTFFYLCLITLSQLVIWKSSFLLNFTKLNCTCTYFCVTKKIRSLSQNKSEEKQCDKMRDDLKICCMG